MSERKRMSPERFEAELARHRQLSFAGVDPRGRPLVRVFDVVHHQGRIYMHGAPRGEKLALLGRPLVAHAHRVVAEIPSHFTDPRRACPATTFYASVQVEGQFSTVDALERKAEVLSQLVGGRQATGSFVAMDPAHPEFARLYAKVIDALWVGEFEISARHGRFNFGQHKSAAVAEAILEGLWTRGAAGDIEAIGEILEAHPQRLAPSWSRGPEGTRLCVNLDRRRTEASARLLEGAYWRPNYDLEMLAGVQVAASAWVGLETPEGELVGTARAVSDGVDYAYIGDVMVAEPWRGRGLGKALTRGLLDHPRLRSVRHQFLVTRDAMELYAPLGFDTLGRLGTRTWMRRRPASVESPR